MVLKNIGITGGSGLLGLHLVKYLLKKKIKITATYRKKIPFKHKDINWVKIDLSKLSKNKNFFEYFKKIDALILNAATTKIIDNKKIYLKDIISTEKLSEWCLLNKIPLAYISGSIVYKINKKKYICENQDFSRNPTGKYYGLSKIKCEKIIKQKRKKGLKAIILRPTSIYGLNQNDKKILNKIKENILKRTPIKIFKKQEKLNLIHASDIAKTLHKLFCKEKFENFNLSFKTNYTFKEVVMIVSKIYGIKPKLAYSNKKSNGNHIQYKLDNSKLFKSIKWLPKISLEKGLKLILKRKYY